MGHCVQCMVERKLTKLLINLHKKIVVKQFFFYVHFCLSEMVTKICTISGQWFLHPESNRTWTNYTLCNAHTNEGRVVGGFMKPALILTETKRPNLIH